MPLATVRHTSFKCYQKLMTMDIVLMIGFIIKNQT